MTEDLRRRYITVREAAAMLSLSESGVRKLSARGLLPIVYLGRLVRLDRRRLEIMLEAQATGQEQEGRR